MNRLPRLRDMSRKAAGYLLSGGGAAVIDISLFRLFAPVMGVMAGATLSFLVAAVVNFLVSSRYVFGGGGGARKAVLFLVFAGVGLVINVTATTLIWQASDLPLILCKTGGVGIAFLFNFAFNFLIVFRARPAHR
ncbi:GtrA family protein [Tardibacter chloracetimidivorans]|nr:GtrA family protein [Tardibacter chloracetimidivorans]